MKRQKKAPDTVEVADTNLEPRDIPLQQPVPTPNDPGGAHAKGYSPDAGPDMQADADTEGPIPLTDTPNDRLMGSDR